jgi:hypothetical protein
MNADTWRTVLVVALSLNAVTGFFYRVYRLSKGGPMSDVIGQAVLAILLIGVAVTTALEWGWARWGALVYGILFGVAVMPVWVLAVLIPQRPGKIDYAFTAAYWIGLVVIVVAAIAL